MRTELVYLLHYERRLQHAQHYLGSCRRAGFAARLARHAAGRGSKLTAAFAAAGIRSVVARTWEGDRKRERQIKNGGAVAKRCPICCGREPDPFLQFIWPAERAAGGHAA